MAERGEGPSITPENVSGGQEGEPIPIIPPQPAAGAEMPAAEEAVREGRPVPPELPPRPEPTPERIPQPPREPPRRIFGREWETPETPSPESIVDRVFSGRGTPGVARAATATKSRREFLRDFVVKPLRWGLLGIIPSIGAYFGIREWRKFRGRRIRETADVRYATHLLKSKENVAAVRDILDAHDKNLRTPVDPNHKSGWRSIFGEKARGFAEVIDMVINDRKQLKEKYAAEGLDDFFSWAEAKEKAGKEINYKALRDEYLKGYLGAEEKYLRVLDELWKVYNDEPGRLMEAIKMRLPEQQEKAPKPESKKPKERDWIAEARKVALKQQASKGKKV